MGSCEKYGRMLHNANPGITGAYLQIQIASFTDTTGSPVQSAKVPVSAKFRKVRTEQPGLHLRPTKANCRSLARYLMVGDTSTMVVLLAAKCNKAM